MLGSSVESLAGASVAWLVTVELVPRPGETVVKREEVTALAELEAGCAARADIAAGWTATVVVPSATTAATRCTALTATADAGVRSCGRAETA
jgi:hypothetical protein